jgi:hypothetical protein
MADEPSLRALGLMFGTLTALVVVMAVATVTSNLGTP